MSYCMLIMCYSLCTVLLRCMITSAQLHGSAEQLLDVGQIQQKQPIHMSPKQCMLD